MSCYFRHIKDIFAEAGIVVDPTNKEQIDRLIHQMVGTSYKDCPGTWKALKQTYLTDEIKRRQLVQELQAAVH
jgi:hypothetical protein